MSPGHLRFALPLLGLLACGRRPPTSPPPSAAGPSGVEAPASTPAVAPAPDTPAPDTPAPDSPTPDSPTPDSPTPEAQGAAAPLTPASIAPDTAETAPGLPPVPRVSGPLALRVVYPGSLDVIAARDSNFVFGSAGTGAARVWVNGYPARVWPNGAWLAWIPLPAGSPMRFRIEARAGGERMTLVQLVRRAQAASGRLRSGTAWVDTTSFSPVGSLWWPRQEYVTLGVRAAGGSRVRLRLPGGTDVPLVPQPHQAEIPAAVRAFDRDTNNLRGPIRIDRYVGAVRGRAFGPDPGPLAGGPDLPLALEVTTRALGLPVAAPAAETLYPVLEVIRGSDTVRAPWPLRLALLDTLPDAVQFVDDTVPPAVPDGLTVGRALPGGTYQWFFPTGTRTLATGRLNGETRVRLSREADAWVPAAETRLLRRGTPAPVATIGSLTLTPLRDRASLRIPAGVRVPFQIIEADRTLIITLYASAGDVDWIRYGRLDSLVRRLSWDQSRADEVTLTVELSAPVWGYRTRWDRDDLILDIRRPPALDPDDPLRGLRIMVDPGHPPGGANGPTGYREAEANLAVSLKLRDLLQSAGARVFMTRVGDVPVDLWPRARAAADSNAELLVSIHNNALPDGLNPFTNNGTSVFYNHPRSLPLATAIQRGLVRRLGVRDLGVARGDLALARPTWMPAVLCEGLFMMLPDQEAALRSAEGQERYARGVYAGIRQFLEGRAREALAAEGRVVAR